MKPCERCGGEKAPGHHGIYCDECIPICRAEREERRRRVKAKRIPCEPFQRVFVQSGMTKADLAREIGAIRGGKADTSRIKRVLGLNGQRTVNPSTAHRLVQALGMDPVDVDL